VKSKTPASIESNTGLDAAVMTEKAEVSNSGADAFLIDKEARIAATEVEQRERAKSLKAGIADSMLKIQNAAPAKLSEVAVSRFAPSATEPAAPVNGWEAYKRYIQESIAKVSEALDQKGKVIVGFKVARNGELQDLKIIQGLSAAADSLALQIIRNGSAWKAASDAKASELKVELDF
ncbi:MAG TPA: energy transducer TonB, partial [Daejeonella sp.]|nr:energy transducer TonB [Daejeonella sp.]